MSLTRLQDDLLRDFKEQKAMVFEQIKLFEPLADSLRKPAAQRLVSKGALIFWEIICYLLCVGTITLAVFLNRIFPFHILSQLRYRAEYRNSLGWLNVEYFNAAVYGLVGLIALLFFVLARNTRRLRLKNDIISIAGKHIKELVGQHLQRKAAIEAIEQRHFLELPDMQYEAATIRVNEVPNPGYDN